MKPSQQKVILATQGQEAKISVRRLALILTWTAEVDLDLLAFYQAKDGRRGGVFSPQYPGGTLGSLYTFPFIELSGDVGPRAAQGKKEEILRISELGDMAELYIVAINYTDAIANRASAFIDYDGTILVINQLWDTIEIPVNAPEKGHAVVACKIENPSPNEAKLINLNLVMDFKDLMNTIPGAERFVRLKGDPRTS